MINKTEFNKEYFIKRCKPFIIYIMFSVLTGVIGTRGFSFFFTHYSVWQIITDMLSFKHACYIEFYFGFVLLIPYLNKMWANSNMTEKQLLNYINNCYEKTNLNYFYPISAGLVYVIVCAGHEKFTIIQIMRITFIMI